MQEIIRGLNEVLLFFKKNELDLVVERYVTKNRATDLLRVTGQLWTMSAHYDSVRLLIHGNEQIDVNDDSLHQTVKLLL